MSRHGFGSTKTCQNGRKMGWHAFCTCICEKKVVPLHPIVHIWTEKMNIREIIKEVRYIYYFSGGVAFFRAKDEKGSYQGLIDKEGEIVCRVGHQMAHTCFAAECISELYQDCQREERVDLSGRTNVGICDGAGMCPSA